MNTTDDSEARIQKAVIKYAADKGLPSIRLVMGRGISSGWPDVLFLPDGGIPHFIEFKAKGKSLSAVQRKRILILGTHGYRTTVCDSIVQGKLLVDDMLKQGTIHC